MTVAAAAEIVGRPDVARLRRCVAETIRRRLGDAGPDVAAVADVRLPPKAGYGDDPGVLADAVLAPVPAGRLRMVLARRDNDHSCLLLVGADTEDNPHRGRAALRCVLVESARRYADGAPDGATTVHPDRLADSDSDCPGAVRAERIAVPLPALAAWPRSERPAGLCAAWCVVAARTDGDADAVTIGGPDGDPIRVDVGGDPTLGEVLERVHAAPPSNGWVTAWIAAAVPERLTLTAGPLTWSIGDAPVLPAASVPMLWLDERTTTPQLVVEYDTTTSTAADARRRAERVDHVLTQWARSPEHRLGDVSLLTAAETAVVAAANETAAEVEPDVCVHELFERQADRTPLAIAVTAEGEHLTYRDLDSRANRVAHALRARGVGPDTVVGVLAPRRIDTIVAMFGVLKAGGAYVPIDPDQPDERLHRLLIDAAPALVVAPDDLVGERPGLADEDAVSVPTLEAAAATADRPTRVGSPDHLAYVIYTSGSTGVPKGVAVAHRQIVNSTAARWADGRFSPGAYAPPVPLSFDASVAAIYWSLTRGGRLVLPTDEAARDPRLFAELIHDERVTHVTGMASFYALVLAAGPELLRTLRDAAIGGEAMPTDLVATHRHTVPNATLWNDYGPTEGTVWSTAHRCDGSERGATVPIGRPIQNVRVHILDDNLRTAPIGVVGQICVSGAGLARGYLHRPAETAEAFVPDPFGGPGARLYLTGDLGRREAGGETVFVGRRDAQLKVRGFRVEPAEVESTLREHADVQSAAVVGRRTAGGDLALHAIVVPADLDAAPTVDTLLAHLRARVPAYMVPTTLDIADALPHAATGKVERMIAPARDPLDTLSEHDIDALVADLVGRSRKAMT